VAEQAGADCFTGVDGHCRDTAVRVPQAAVAAVRTHDHEAGFLQARINAFPVTRFIKVSSDLACV